MTTAQDLDARGATGPNGLAPTDSLAADIHAAAGVLSLRGGGLGYMLRRLWRV